MYTTLVDDEIEALVSKNKYNANLASKSFCDRLTYFEKDVQEVSKKLYSFEELPIHDKIDISFFSESRYSYKITIDFSKGKKSQVKYTARCRVRGHDKNYGYICEIDIDSYSGFFTGRKYRGQRGIFLTVVPLNEVFFISEIQRYLKIVNVV